MDPDFIDAVVHYRTIFPSIEALGAGNPPANWKKELDDVTPEAFDPLLGTDVSLESGNVRGQALFAAKWKVRALHAVRAELDPSYRNPYTRPIDEPMIPRRSGTVVRFGL